MKLNIHFLEAEGSLSPWRAVMQTQADAVADRIDKTLPPEFQGHPVDVVIQYLPDETIPELGIGGSCFRRGLVTINLDPEVPDFEDRLDQGVFGCTLAHELHHAMRWDAGGYGLSLGEAFVSEGLADVFSETVTGVSAPPWANTSINGDWAAVLDQAEQERDSQDYDHAAWFYGTGELPRWVGTRSAITWPASTARPTGVQPGSQSQIHRAPRSRKTCKGRHRRRHAQALGDRQRAGQS